MQAHPKHIAIIMDGNGRWAQERGLPRNEGHLAGLQAVKAAVRACVKQNVAVLSLFAFSSENWRRPAEEVTALMELFVQALEEEIAILEQNQVSIRFIGDLTQLSPLLQGMIKGAEKQTAHHNRLSLNIAVNYGGRWDLVQATRALAKAVLNQNLSPDDIDENALSQRLCTAHLPDPDLLIRTSGEERISNFFLWQAAYTELYFTDIFWPDFTEAHMEEAIEAFKQRKRRFGKSSHL